jgi:hydrogenase nickel incorporation protein HypA/HybF
MHELSLTESILSLVVAEAVREGMREVSRVELEVGAGSAIEVDTLRYCFPIVAAGTVAERADLVVNRVTMQARCRECATEFVAEELISPCPRCGAHGPTILSGRGMRVKSFTGE